MSLLRGGTLVGLRIEPVESDYDKYEKLLKTRLRGNFEAGEKVKLATSGFLKSFDCAVLLTTRRIVLLYLNEKKITGIEQITYSKVLDIDVKLGLLSGMIIIESKKGKFVLKNINKEHATSFKGLFLRLMKKAKLNVDLSYSKTYVNDVMEKLEFLRDHEIISEEDYHAQKSELLTV